MNENKSMDEKENLKKPDEVEVAVLGSSDEWAQKKRIYKNLLVVAFSYLFFFSAANGLNNLQSSLNSHDNLGVYTLLCSSVSFLAACLFVPMLFCRLFGFKWSLIICQTTCIVYIAANYYPSIYTLVPAGIAFGAALSVVWTLQGSFIVHISNEYYAISSDKKHTEKIMFKFFGIFMIVFQLNQISGNIISAIVFNESAKSQESDLPDYEQHKNLLLTLNSSTNLQVCGSHDCPGPGTEIKRPADEQVFWLCMCYFILTVTGILLLLVMMDDIRPSKEDLGSLSKSVKDIFKMFLNKKIWALLPLFAFLATYNTFIIIDFSKSYLACLYGIKYIGNAFIVCGLASSVFSFFVSQLTKVVNKTLILVMALSTVICMMAYLKLGEQSFTYMTIVYFMPLTFGLLEGVWGTVINALIGIAFADENTTIAFSNNRFTMSMFFFITYSYSGFLCVYMKIYLVIGLSLLSIFSSTIFELLLRKELKVKLSQANFANS